MANPSDPNWAHQHRDNYDLADRHEQEAPELEEVAPKPTVANDRQAAQAESARGARDKDKDKKQELTEQDVAPRREFTAAAAPPPPPPTTRVQAHRGALPPAELTTADEPEDAPQKPAPPGQAADDPGPGVTEGHAWTVAAAPPPPDAAKPPVLGPTWLATTDDAD